MNFEAELSINRFVPIISNATSISASPPIAVTAVTMPLPKALCRTVSPFFRLMACWCALPADAAEDPGAVLDAVEGADADVDAAVEVWPGAGRRCWMDERPMGRTPGAPSGLGGRAWFARAENAG